MLAFPSLRGKTEPKLRLSQCCSLADSVWLPAYSSPSPKLTLKPLPMSCYCTIDTKDLFDRDGVALSRAGSIDEPSSEARVLGQEKSPAVVDGAALALPLPLADLLS